MGAVVAALLLTAATGGCSDGEAADGTTTTENEAAEASTTTVGVEQDPTLEPFLLTSGALPDGFAVSEQGLDDTITSFCAGEDAAAGLSASGRAGVAFTRMPSGASVIQIVHRFNDGGAEAFVAAVDAILERCSEVPDLTGLAFTYEPLSPDLDAALAGADDAAGSYGMSVGSEALTIDIAALRHGDVAQLVAVLGLDLPREELDAIARQAFTAAAAQAQAAA